jgi:hypothetical protein
MRGFIVVIPYMCTVYFEQVYPFEQVLTSPFSPPFLVFGGLHYTVFKHTHAAYFNPLPHSVHLPFPLFSPIAPSPYTVPLSHSCPIIIVILSLGSRNE